MNIVYLYGGRSGEHEISFLSCATLVRNTDRKHNITLIAITKNGKWFLQDNSLVEQLRNDSKAVLTIVEDEKKAVSVIPGGGNKKTFFAEGKFIETDVVIPALHGTYGEDGTIQGLMELAGLPYVGCGVLSSSITMDKATSKIIWEAKGLPVVPYECLTRSDINDSNKYDEKIKLTINKLGFPLFVKPCSAGSSDGASKANNEKELSIAIMEAFLWDDKILIEKAVDAREVECAVTGNSVNIDNNDFTKLKVYGPGEIIPTHEFYDYDAKYVDPDGAKLKIPALLSEDKLSFIKDIAIKAYAAVDAAGLSRVDFFIDRKTDKIYLNEINTLPGFTSISMFPKLCMSEGMSFSDIIELLISEALSRFEARNKLCTSR